MKIIQNSSNNLKFITLENKKLKITLCNLGASIFSIYFNNELMTMTNENIEEFELANVYNGKTVGRTCNRIKGSIINIDDKLYFLKNNEGFNTLHGGEDGLSNQIFKDKIVESKNSAKVIFAYSSPDSESGFPGQLNLKVTYTIFEKTNKYTIKFEAKTSKPTLCNLTNHTFFTLGEKSIDCLFLKINASKYVECGVDDLIPNKEKAITNSLDFRKFKCLSKDINNLRFGKQNGYDHCLICDENLILSLESKKYLLKIKSDFDCCQIYSDNWPTGLIKWVDLPNSTNRAIAIEPQDNILKRKILRPNEKYKKIISYDFMLKK